MARKKREEEAGAGAPWLNTFADLMNLLLCFFVLLFASSTVDAEKYDNIVSSMSNSFGIFSSGGAGVGEGRLISSGINQLNNLNEYYNTMGKSSEETGDKETESGTGVSEDPSEIILKENKEASQEMFDEIADLSDQYNLGNYMQLTIDPNYQFVQISLSGSILFDSGKAEIKPKALPIFSKVGDILKVFDTHRIELEGHTDNVPIHNSGYGSNNWLSSARALNAATYLIEEKGISPNFLSWTGRGEYDPVASNTTEEGRAKNRRVEIKIYNDLNK